MQRRAFGSGGWYATAGALAFLPPATRGSEKNSRSAMVETLKSPARHAQSSSGTYSSAIIASAVANSFRIVLGTEPSYSSCPACAGRCHRGAEKKPSWHSFGGGKARPKSCKFEERKLAVRQLKTSRERLYSPGFRVPMFIFSLHLKTDPI